MRTWSILSTRSSKVWGLEHAGYGRAVLELEHVVVDDEGEAAAQHHVPSNPRSHEPQEPVHEQRAFEGGKRAGYVKVQVM